MLDALLGRGAFTSKCKSLIKPTKSRIVVLRRREEAKQRFLKEDLAKLLANGLDINAYGRTEEFLAGSNLLTCYNFIEQSCEYLLKQLSLMQKQSGCPEDCRETVASLMFAAARFSDLPELRDLRDVLKDRYGSGLECFVNQVFVERLTTKPPSVEKRLHLLQDIAVEFSIVWDSKGFKQRMDKSSTLAQDQPKKHGPPHVIDDNYKLPNSRDAFQRIDKHGVTSKERTEHVSHGNKLSNGRDVSIFEREELNIQFAERQENTVYRREAITRNDDNRARRELVKRHGSSIGLDDTVLKIKSPIGLPLEQRPDDFVKDPLCHGKYDGDANGARSLVRDVKGVSYVNGHHPSQENTSKSTRNMPEEVERLKSCRSNSLPPPYNLSQKTALKSTEEEEEAERLKACRINSLPPPYIKSKDNFIPPPYSKAKDNGANVVISLDVHTRQDHPYHENSGNEEDRNYQKYRARRRSKHAGSSSHASSVASSPRIGANAVMSSDKFQTEPANSRHEEHGLRKDHHYQNEIPLPKPRSMRRKHSKSSSSHDDVGSSEDGRTARKSSSSSRRRDRKGLQILFDDEHHQRDEEERMMDKLLLHYSKKTSSYDITKLRKKPQSNSRESPADVFPARSISLPREQTSGSESQPTKVFARANSFQPDNQARHVHPKLPDYDDLAARFAALRGR